MSSRRTVSLVTLGCARNEVDSEELAGRLAAGGWELVNSETGEKADVVVHTCGFIEPAKQESVDTLLSAACDGTFEGRAAHQAPEVDGSTLVRGHPALQVGQMVSATVVESLGADLVAEVPARKPAQR